MNRELIGEASCPSGIVLIVDMGYLGTWSHDRPPVMPASAGPPQLVERANSAVDYRVDGPDADAAMRLYGQTPGWLYDRTPAFAAKFEAAVAEKNLEASIEALPARVPHRQRIAHALRDGRRGSVVPFHGARAVCVGALPGAEVMPVYGTRLGDGDYADCWRHVELVVGTRDVATTEVLGQVMVDWARLAFVDADALGAWQHEKPTDGKADFVFWGRDAAAVADACNALALEDGQYGWTDLPVYEAFERGKAVEALRGTRDLKFAADFRPHSHHYHMMARVRSTPTESGTLELAGSRMCAFMTSWGDGQFPVELDLDAAGQPQTVRITLATDRALANMDAVNR